MSFRLRFLVLALAALSFAPAARAAGSYWDFNSDTKIPLLGSGTLTTAAIVVGATIFDIETYGSGTELNRLGSVPAGDSLSYLDVGFAFSDHVMEFTHLDFSSINGVSISFAFRSTEVFSLTDSEYIAFEYSTDGGAHYSSGGSYVIAGTDFSDWRVISNSFGSSLDGLSDVTLRVSTFASFGVASSTQYDNIQVVPEPGVAALLAAPLMLGLLLLNRRAKAA